MPYGNTRTRIGARRSRIAFQKPSTSDDGMGGQNPTWTTVGHAWAEMTGLDERARESLAALQIQGRAVYHADIRHRTGLDPTMRVKWRDKTLEIQSVQDDTGLRRRQILLLTEVQPSG